MARLTNKQKFDKFKDKIIPLGLRILADEEVTDEDYSTFDVYARELYLFKPSITLNEDDIISLHWFVSLVYQCIYDRTSHLKHLFIWSCERR